MAKCNKLHLHDAVYVTVGGRVHVVTAIARHARLQRCARSSTHANTSLSLWKSLCSLFVKPAAMARVTRRRSVCGAPLENTADLMMSLATGRSSLTAQLQAELLGVLVVAVRGYVPEAARNTVTKEVA